MQPRKISLLQFIGYGNTPDCNGCNKALFLKLVFDNIVGFDRILGETTKAVIVSPSMSGSWSLPFIKKHQGILEELHKLQNIQISYNIMRSHWFQNCIKTITDRVLGYIPVAPVGTSNYKEFFRNSMKIPTMIVYGEKDTGLGTSSYKDLKEIATSTKVQVLPDARHPAYLDQPEEWHNLLHNFLQLLKWKSSQLALSH